MNRYLRYALLALLWGAVAAYILYAGSTAQRLRAARTVGKVEIQLVDGLSGVGAHGARVDRAQRDQDERHGS